MLTFSVIIVYLMLVSLSRTASPSPTHQSLPMQVVVFFGCVLERYLQK